MSVDADGVGDESLGTESTDADGTAPAAGRESESESREPESRESESSEGVVSSAHGSSGPRHRVLAAVDVVVGLLLLGAIWGALPARWWPIDAGGSALALLFGASGLGLWLGRPWAARLGRWAAGVILASGLLLVTAVAWTAADLFGRYGPVGMGGGLILFVVFLLLVPYLVLLPAAQLYVLGSRADAGDA